VCTIVVLRKDGQIETEMTSHRWDSDSGTMATSDAATTTYVFGFGRSSTS
jgi:hypothetical protein